MDAAPKGQAVALSFGCHGIQGGHPPAADGAQLRPGQACRRESLERIAAAAQRAPSAGFSQGQRLVIVTEESTRRAIAEICDEPEYVAAGFDPWVSRAPALIVPCVSEEVYHRRYREPDKIAG